VLGRIPRHLFVPEDKRRFAYEDRPLPIGYGQTISQPYIVALMTDLLAVDDDDAVLEIGTGSGYQAAVLSRLAKRVYTIEIVPALAKAADERLRRLGFDNVTVRQGDGYYGWREHAPFDGMVVTAATSHIPPPLIQQLSRGGRMIIPVGGPFFVQRLMMIEKHLDGTVTSRHLLPVRFVPLTGGH
jgi:protein-L-isoaspartate(D-aspartate) O-methyltransferase